MLVICLIEEDIFPVSTKTLGCVFFQCTILGDTMLLAKMLPKMRSNLIAAGARDVVSDLDGRCSGRIYLPALACLERDQFSRHDCRCFVRVEQMCWSASSCLTSKKPDTSRVARKQHAQTIGSPIRISLFRPKFGSDSIFDQLSAAKENLKKLRN